MLIQIKSGSLSLLVSQGTFLGHHCKILVICLEEMKYLIIVEVITRQILTLTRPKHKDSHLVKSSFPQQLQDIQWNLKANLLNVKLDRMCQLSHPVIKGKFNNKSLFLQQIIRQLQISNQLRVIRLIIT